MIQRHEIATLPAVRKAIWKRQNVRCMLVKAIQGKEPYCWRYKNKPQQKLNTLNHELEILKQYRIITHIEELKNSIDPRIMAAIAK